MKGQLYNMCCARGNLASISDTPSVRDLSPLHELLLYTLIVHSNNDLRF